MEEIRRLDVERNDVDEQGHRPLSLRQQLELVPPNLLEVDSGQDEAAACGLPEDRVTVMEIKEATTFALLAAANLADDLAGLAERASAREVQQAIAGGRLPHNPVNRWRMAIVMPYLRGNVAERFGLIWANFRRELMESPHDDGEKLRQTIAAVNVCLGNAVVGQLRQLQSACIKSLAKTTVASRPAGRPPSAYVKERNRRIRDESKEAGVTERNALHAHMQQVPEFMDYIREVGLGCSPDICRRALEEGGPAGH